MSIEEKILTFFVDNPYPPDKKIHDLADTMKIRGDEFEAKIYGILSDVIEHGKGMSNANSKELSMGIKVESEHTKYPELAKYIALAHLKEIPDYYTRLKKMEDEAKGDKEMAKSKKAVKYVIIKKGYRSHGFRMARGQEGGEERASRKARKKQEGDYSPHEERMQERSRQRREDYS